MVRAADALLTATETFTAEVDGETYVVHAGQLVASSSALVKGREALFAEQGPDVEAPEPKQTRARKTRR